MEQNFSGTTINTGGGDVGSHNVSTVINAQTVYYGSIGAASVSHTPEIPYKSMPSSSPRFTGRQDYLDKLKAYFGPRSDHQQPRRAFLLHGMGGIGKTQICLKFLEECSDRSWHVFWIDATNTQTAQQSFLDIALIPDAQASGVEKTSKSVLKWLSVVDHEWLLVFDNADGEPDMVQEFLPSGNRGNVLITSRNPNMQSIVPHGASVEVDQMDKDDAVSLLLRGASLTGSSPTERKASELIVEKLYCLPLAVDQAGAAIASGLCDISDYLGMYTRHSKELLAHDSFKGASKYGRAAYATWDVSFMEIQARGSADSDLAKSQAAKSAISILQLFSFFHNENIMEDIFKRAAEADEEELYNSDKGKELPHAQPSLPFQFLQVDNQGDWDPLIFRGGIQVLLSFSLVKKGSLGKRYSMHPLVHAWSRDRMVEEMKQMQYCSAKALLCCSITFQYNSEDHAYRQLLIPHVKACSQYATEVNTSQAYADDEYMNFGFVLYENGYWKEAEELQVQVMAMRKRVLGTGHLDTLLSMATLALTFWNQGRWKEAEELEVQVMEMTKKVLGAEHPFTLTSMNNLASTFWNQGRWKEAEELEVQVMEMRKRVLGAEHPSTLNSINNLALTFSNQGRWKEAEGLQVQVMEMTERVLGAEHPETLTSRANLALTFWNQGRWKEAEELQVQMMEMTKRVLGAEHPDTLTSMGNLALTFSNQGRWKEAEELQVQVMEMIKRVLEAKHPDTLTSMGNLALTFLNQRRWKEAEELQVQVMEMRKRVLGPEHPDTLTSMDNLALTFLNQGRWKEAEELFVQVMEMRKRVLGAEHPSTLQSMGNLAVTFLNQGRWKEAEELNVQVMEMRKRVLGAEHPETLTSMVNLAHTWKSQGQGEEALDLLKQAYALRQQRLGPDHPDTVSSASTLHEWQQQQQRPGPNHPDIAPPVSPPQESQQQQVAAKGKGKWRPKSLQKLKAFIGKKTHLNSGNSI